MTFSLFFILLAFSSPLLAGSSTEERLKFLENRVQQLEARLGNGAIQKSSISGLKVKDMKNSRLERSVGSANSGEATPSISTSQQKEIMKQIEAFKKKRSESQKMLDELMKDEF
jgi:hypothetical protein